MVIIIVMQVGPWLEISHYHYPLPARSDLCFLHAVVWLGPGNKFKKHETTIV